MPTASVDHQASPLSIRLHVPSRSRPTRAYESIVEAIRLARVPSRIELSFALDTDDHAAEGYRHLLQEFESFVAGVTWLPPGSTKIKACNAVADGPWDVLVLLSDDMRCIVPGWDAVIDRDVAEFGGKNAATALWYPDGNHDALCTLSVMTRPLYDAFGYVYHPDYLSLWCDNEYHETCEQLGILRKRPVVLFQHMHWSAGLAPKDALYERCDGDWAADEATFVRRKAAGFEVARVKERIAPHRSQSCTSP